MMETKVDTNPQAAKGRGDEPSGDANATRHLPEWLGMTLVLALTFAVYIPTFGYKFVHDDRGQIVENPAVHSWRYTPSYFTRQVWAGVTPEEAGNYYRPIFLLWVRFNDMLFGKNPAGWHVTTVLAHVLTTFLVYLLALRLGTGRDVALLAALIFGLHPAHIEGVAWISGVTEPLLGIFLIGALLAYMKWRADTPHARRWMATSLVLYAIALLEKETAIIFPGILFAYEAIFGWESGERLSVKSAVAWSRKFLAFVWPYCLVIVLYLPVRIYALRGFSHRMASLTIAQVLFTWPTLIEFWIRHLVWPTGLSTFYNLYAVLEPTMENFTLPALFDLGCLLLLFLWARRSRTAAFFAVWLVLPLLPVLDIRLFLSNDFAHDRYLYLPSMGLAVLVGMFLIKVCRGPQIWPGMPASLLAVVLCLAGLMSYGTITEGSYFKDNLTFYADILKKAPHNPYAETNYATLLAEGGQYGPAIARYLEIVDRDPSYYVAVYDLGLTYYKMGKLPQAEEYLIRAIQVGPDHSDQYLYLGLARFKSGHTAEAIPCVQRAIALHPNGYAYHFALGMMLKSQGDLKGALQEFNKELANNPNEKDAADQAREIARQLAAPSHTAK